MDDWLHDTIHTIALIDEELTKISQCLSQILRLFANLEKAIDEKVKNDLDTTNNSRSSRAS